MSATDFSNPEIISQPVATIVGGGLAGCEAAWQIARRGILVRLIEMRPEKTTSAHQTDKLAELVCSNSLRGAALTNAVGLLKEELRRLQSLVLCTADATAVPAGGALAVDRQLFSEQITRTLSDHPLISIERREVAQIPATGFPDQITIISSGPLTSPALSQAIQGLIGSQHFAFYDAISPIVTIDSLDQTKMFKLSRYDKGSGDDYLNIPLSLEQYSSFVKDIELGEKFLPKHEESDPLAESQQLKPFEGCMPIEDMVNRGPQTLRFGPLKPMGLTDPLTGRRPYAVIQLRQDDREGRLWSMVGMQTRLKQSEQLRIFRSLPGMDAAEFVRLGSVHRNSYINSPSCLQQTMQFGTLPALFFAGQITGVEGYVESTASGLVAGINAARIIKKQQPIIFPTDTAIGALMHYVTDETRKEFQPMNISYGIIPSYFEPNETSAPDLTGSKRPRKEPKDERRQRTAARALASLKTLIDRESI